MSDKTERKIIDHVERIGTSHYGNPTYLVTFTDGTSARTMTDTAWGYEASNRDNHGVSLDVTFTQWGRVRYCRKVAE